MTDINIPSHVDKPVEDECALCGLINGFTLMALAGCLIWLGFRLGELAMAWAGALS